MYSYAIATLFAGILIDKFGGIKVLTVGAVIFSLGSLLFANTSSIPLLYIARGFLGIGAATFYLSLITESKKCFSDKYFGIILSIILFIGFLGGIVANAPFVICVSKFGLWNVMNFMGILAFGFTVLYVVCQYFVKSNHNGKNVSLSLKPYKEVFMKSNNLYLFTFYVLSTVFYFAIFTVIGTKFLSDYLSYSASKSAFIMSIFLFLASFAGIILSTLCKITGNKRVPFLKFLSYSSCFAFVFIAVCIFFNIKTIFIPIVLLLLAFNGGMGPVTIPVAMNTNEEEIRGTMMSVMNSLGFVVVGIFATVIGHILDMFPIAGKIGTYNIYSNQAYLTIFLLFIISAGAEIFVAHKIKESV